MEIRFSAQDIKDLILENLQGTFSEDMINSLSSDKIKFYTENGNDHDGYYMEHVEVFEMHIKEDQ